jgi:plasmid maintenance system antidote protein VapI
MINNAEIIKRMEEFMAKKDFSQEQFAQKLKITRTWLNLILNGKKPLTKKVSIRFGLLEKEITEQEQRIIGAL